MDETPRAETHATVELGAAGVEAPSMNGFGAGTPAGNSDTLLILGAVFLGALLLGGLVSRIGS